MDALTLREQMYKLVRRRGEITLTLDRLAQNRSGAEQNTDWLDQAACESRIDVLDRLSNSHLAELKQIDSALERIAKARYGICLACRQPIDLQRLQAAPEAEFCAPCQEVREELQNV
jgi:RNA polymerase-binding transcription factor DksA